MWLQFIFGIVICCLLVIYLVQIRTWTLPSFRQGIVVRKYQEHFSGQIPKKLLNQEIICKNVIFNFDTPNTGLFRARPRTSFFRIGYFPSFLGEIKLSRKGTAQITLRISLPKTLILLALYVVFIIFIFNTERVFSINSTLNRVGTLLFLGFFSIIGFSMEKDDLRDGISMLREHAEDMQKQKTNQLELENTLSNQKIGKLNKELAKIPSPIFGILFFIGGVYGSYFSLISLLGSSENAILLLFLSIISIIIGIIQFTNRNKIYRENYKPKLDKVHKRK